MQKPPSARQQYTKKSMFWGAGACLLLLAVSGRLNWVVAALSVVLAFVLRFLPVLLRYAPQLQKLWVTLRQQGFFSERRSDFSRNSGVMTIDEAYKILGLPGAATDKEIIEAHRKLILKNHPDRGGSSYLAAQINLAKDMLLKK
ncbi:MAG: DnaJ domain-containing protein [Methyloprofundus sp.]|nr:DnaJ domain-containing protein [Methyloprofundus sp.]